MVQKKPISKSENIVPIDEASDTLKIKEKRILNYGIKGQIGIGVMVGVDKVYYFTEEDLATIKNSDKPIHVSKFLGIYAECPDRGRKSPPTLITTNDLDFAVSINTLCITLDGLECLQKILKNESRGSGLKDTGIRSLFMDVENNILYLDKNNSVNLRPEEINLIKYMQRQESFKLEQILTEHFRITLTEIYKHSMDMADILSSNTAVRKKGKAIDKGERNKFDAYKSNINKKSRTLGIGDLIIKQGDIKKAFKLSVNITKKEFKR